MNASYYRLVSIINIFLLIIISCIGSSFVFAGPTSVNYELKTYGFGAGGIATSSSTNYNLMGIAGQTDQASLSGSTYNAGVGLVFVNQSNVPPAPDFTNPSSTYNRLKLVIHTGGNPSDTVYAVAISKDNWATTQYVKSDFTPGDMLTNADWLTYTEWGAGTGQYISGLSSDTQYKVKVSARQGSYTQTGWGPDTQATTSVPSLTFGLDAATIIFDPLMPANSWTDSSKSTTITTSTNAYNGYTVYAHNTSPLTSNGNVIADYASSNASPTTWSGTGFGYTTNDADLFGGTPDRFTNGGPKYAGLTTAVPGDPVADHTAPVIDTPVTNEQFTIQYRVTAPPTTYAGTYKNTVVYVVVPIY